MGQKFCLSPWRSSFYGDDHFQVNLKPFVENKGNVVQFLSARPPQRLAKLTIDRNSEQSISKKTRLTSRKENVNRLEQLRPAHRSADITPSKKEPLKLNVITSNTKNLNIGPRRQHTLEPAKDSHQLLITRLIRLKKEGKLHLKESLGQRILRF